MADTSLSAQIEQNYKVSKWSRNTVADGSWLQKYTVEKLTNRDIFLANAIDTMNSGTDGNLSSLSAAISYVSATHDEYIDYLSATLSGNIENVSALNEKVSSFSSEYKTFVSATNERFNNLESSADGLQNQIDQLKIATDVVAVFGTHDEFTANSAGTWQQQITDNDTIKVLNDNDEYQVYYEWHDPNAAQPHTDWTGWSAIGNLDPYYSKTDIENAAGKNIKITTANGLKISTSSNVEFGTVDAWDLSFISAAGDNLTVNYANILNANVLKLSARNLYGQSNSAKVDTLIGSAQSGAEASAYITEHSADFLNSAHSAYGTLTFGTKAYPATNSNYNFTFLAGQGIGFTTANNQVTISAEGTTYQASSYISTANKKISVTGSLITSAEAGSAASAWVNNNLFDYSYTDIDTKSTSGSIDKITVLYKNDATDHDVMLNQEVVFERDNYSVSGLLIQAANSTTDNGKVLTYNSTANNYTWQEIPPSTYSNADGFISIDNTSRKINLSTTGIKTSAYSAEYITDGNHYNSELNGKTLSFSYGQSTLELSLTGISYIQGGVSDSTKWDNLFKNYAEVNRTQLNSNDLTADKVNFIVATGTSDAYKAVNFIVTAILPTFLDDDVYYII